MPTVTGVASHPLSRVRSDSTVSLADAADAAASGGIRESAARGGGGVRRMPGAARDRGGGSKGVDWGCGARACTALADEARRPPPPRAPRPPPPGARRQTRSCGRAPRARRRAARRARQRHRGDRARVVAARRRQPQHRRPRPPTPPPPPRRRPRCARPVGVAHAPHPQCRGKRRRPDPVHAVLQQGHRVHRRRAPPAGHRRLAPPRRRNAGRAGGPGAGPVADRVCGAAGEILPPLLARVHQRGPLLLCLDRAWRGVGVGRGWPWGRGRARRATRPPSFPTPCLLTPSSPPRPEQPGRTRARHLHAHRRRRVPAIQSPLPPPDGRLLRRDSRPRPLPRVPLQLAQPRGPSRGRH